jgi:hypothetical protein
MTNKVMEKIGRQYVRLVAEKLMELESRQRDIAEKISSMMGVDIRELLASDPEKAIRFLYETAYLVEHYYRLTKELEQFKQHFENVRKAMEGEAEKHE